MSPVVDLTKDAENQTLQPNSTAGARKKKTKRKNNNCMPQESNALDQSIVETPKYTTTLVTADDLPSVNLSQPSAAGKKKKQKQEESNRNRWRLYSQECDRKQNGCNGSY